MLYHRAYTGARTINGLCPYFFWMIDLNGCNRTIFFNDGTPAPELLTEAEAVRFLRIDQMAVKNPGSTLRRYRDCGQLKAIQISRELLYPLASLLEFIERQLEDAPR